MVHPKVKVVDEGTTLSESLTPVYSTVKGLGQATLIRMIQKALSMADMEDTLPEEILADYQLSGFRESVCFLHQPSAEFGVAALTDGRLPAWQRLKFDELLAQQLSMRLAYERRQNGKAPVLNGQGHLVSQLLEMVGFRLTAAQSTVWQEIKNDLAQNHPMHRLLQGDVGSGKTIIAAISALIAIESGYQVALMAPTEILAEQHFRKFKDWLTPLGLQVQWLAGSLRKKEKDNIKALIASGTVHIAVGTHALFQEDVIFANLGLAIVDEQHRFGVAQRLALKNKGESIHQLMLSATPIPRTLAMSYFADLDVSVIDELPPGRTPIKTKLAGEYRRGEIEARVLAACQAGQQVYWVCPLIEESETLQLQTAIQTYEDLSQTFPDLRVGLVHGRLKPAEKAELMARFQGNEIQVLVATTVIEVGVDVPNASLMVIEHAERMGLAQLHQLRGRVGRGSAQSMCVLLFHEPLSELAKARLKIIYENTDGFEIARQDLQLRGPGEFLGARQSGLPMFRFVNLEEDTHLLDKARNAAITMLRDHKKASQQHLNRYLTFRQDFLNV